MTLRDTDPALPVALAMSVALVRDGLACLLATAPGIHLVALAPHGTEPAPRALLTDAEMIGSGACHAALARICPRPALVVLGVPDDDTPRIVTCAAAGVAGFVPAAADVHELAAVLHAAVRGDVICSPRIAARLVGRIAGAPAEPAGGEALTPRESGILELLELGLSNKEIAVRLGIEVPTVKNHVHNILAKLRLRRRSQAAAWRRPAPAWAGPPVPPIRIEA